MYLHIYKRREFRTGVYKGNEKLLTRISYGLVPAFAPCGLAGLAGFALNVQNDQEGAGD